ncbi:MAG: hypothetical protein PF638_07485 [Candidatus Delongbacteria bacterium]|nr:hypothetical protein [Candidatus Delongbacteria bacterium]
MYYTEWDLQPIVKYEFFDPSKEVDKVNYGFATKGYYAKTNMTFGLNYFFNDWTRLQMNYIMKQEEFESFDNDQILVQLQVKF